MKKKTDEILVHAFCRHPGYYTLVQDGQGHVFRMDHGKTPPPGFDVIPDVCEENGILKNIKAFGFARTQDAFSRGGKMLRAYRVFTRKEIAELTRAMIPITIYPRVRVNPAAPVKPSGMKGCSRAAGKLFKGERE